MIITKTHLQTLNETVGKILQLNANYQTKDLAINQIPENQEDFTRFCKVHGEKPYSNAVKKTNTMVTLNF